MERLEQINVSVNGVGGGVGTDRTVVLRFLRKNVKT